MQDIKPEHLAAVMLRAKAETALHVRNVGIYGNSSDSTAAEGWLQLRDYLLRQDVETWTYGASKPSHYRAAMAKAERAHAVYVERILAKRVLDILARDMVTAARRQTLH